jgi:hypothetical protein
MVLIIAAVNQEVLAAPSVFFQSRRKGLMGNLSRLPYSTLAQMPRNSNYFVLWRRNWVFDGVVMISDGGQPCQTRNDVQ